MDLNGNGRQPFMDKRFSDEGQSDFDSIETDELHYIAKP